MRYPKLYDGVFFDVSTRTRIRFWTIWWMKNITCLRIRVDRHLAEVAVDQNLARVTMECYHESQVPESKGV